MAAIYALSSASCLSSRRCVPGFYLLLNPLFPLLHRRSISLPSKPLAVLRKSIRAVAEGETAAPAEEPATDTVVAAATEEEKGATVTFPVSPSDLLTMYFQAEGMMDESAIPVVSKALQGSEGISDVSVRVEEGIATVELTKQTTVQATGVASNLVEIIQGAGFKLQSLNLSFEDEEDAVSVR